MDAVEFLMEKERMCESHSEHCCDCELHKEQCCNTHKTKEQAKKAVAIVERWAKEHPKKTRAGEFLKEYPNASLSVRDGYPSVNPCILDHSLLNKSKCDEGCTDCRRKYWMEEIE